MSTVNFITQDNFPLFIFEYENLEHEWACPDCSCDEYGYPLQPVLLENNYDGSYTCPRCGCTTTCPEADMCEDRGVPHYRMQDWFDDVQAELDEVNADFQKWEIRLIEGYYYDAQLIAFLKDIAPEWCMCSNRYWPEDPNEYTGQFEPYDDAADRVAIEWANNEMPRVRQTMREFAKYHGFKEYALMGVFSNGEGVYTEVK